MQSTYYRIEVFPTAVNSITTISDSDSDSDSESEGFAGIQYVNKVVEAKKDMIGVFPTADNSFTTNADRERDGFARIQNVKKAVEAKKDRIGFFPTTDNSIATKADRNREGFAGIQYVKKDVEAKKDRIGFIPTADNSITTKADRNREGFAGIQYVKKDVETKKGLQESLPFQDLKMPKPNIKQILSARISQLEEELKKLPDDLSLEEDDHAFANDVVCSRKSNSSVKQDSCRFVPQSGDKLSIGSDDPLSSISETHDSRSNYKSRFEKDPITFHWRRITSPSRDSKSEDNSIACRKEVGFSSEKLEPKAPSLTRKVIDTSSQKRKVSPAPKREQSPSSKRARLLVKDFKSGDSPKSYSKDRVKPEENYMNYYPNERVEKGSNNEMTSSSTSTRNLNTKANVSESKKSSDVMSIFEGLQAKFSSNVSDVPNLNILVETLKKLEKLQEELNGKPQPATSSASIEKARETFAKTNTRPDTQGQKSISKSFESNQKLLLKNNLLFEAETNESSKRQFRNETIEMGLRSEKLEPKVKAPFLTRKVINTNSRRGEVSPAHKSEKSSSSKRDSSPPTHKRRNSPPPNRRRPTSPSRRRPTSPSRRPTSPSRRRPTSPSRRPTSPSRRPTSPSRRRRPPSPSTRRRRSPSPLPLRKRESISPRRRRGSGSPPRRLDSDSPSRRRPEMAFTNTNPHCEIDRMARTTRTISISSSSSSSPDTKAVINTGQSIRVAMRKQESEQHLLSRNLAKIPELKSKWDSPEKEINKKNTLVGQVVENITDKRTTATSGDDKLMKEWFEVTSVLNPEQQILNELAVRIKLNQQIDKSVEKLREMEKQRVLNEERLKTLIEDRKKSTTIVQSKSEKNENSQQFDRSDSSNMCEKGYANFNMHIKGSFENGSSDRTPESTIRKDSESVETKYKNEDHKQKNDSKTYVEKKMSFSISKTKLPFIGKMPCMSKIGLPKKTDEIVHTRESVTISDAKNENKDKQNNGDAKSILICPAIPESKYEEEKKPKTTSKKESSAMKSLDVKKSRWGSEVKTAPLIPRSVRLPNTSTRPKRAIHAQQTKAASIVKKRSANYEPMEIVEDKPEGSLPRDFQTTLNILFPLQNPASHMIEVNDSPQLQDNVMEAKDKELKEKIALQLQLLAKKDKDEKEAKKKILDELAMLGIDEDDLAVEPVSLQSIAYADHEMAHLPPSNVPHPGSVRAGQIEHPSARLMDPVHPVGDMPPPIQGSLDHGSILPVMSHPMGQVPMDHGLLGPGLVNHGSRGTGSMDWNLHLATIGPGPMPGAPVGPTHMGPPPPPVGPRHTGPSPDPVGPTHMEPPPHPVGPRHTGPSGPSPDPVGPTHMGYPPPPIGPTHMGYPPPPVGPTHKGPPPPPVGPRHTGPSPDPVGPTHMGYPPPPVGPTHMGYPPPPVSPRHTGPSPDPVGPTHMGYPPPPVGSTHMGYPPPPVGPTHMEPPPPPVSPRHTGPSPDPVGPTHMGYPPPPVGPTHMVEPPPPLVGPRHTGPSPDPVGPTHMGYPPPPTHMGYPPPPVGPTHMGPPPMGPSRPLSPESFIDKKGIKKNNPTSQKERQEMKRYRKEELKAKEEELKEKIALQLQLLAQKDKDEKVAKKKNLDELAMLGIYEDDLAAQHY